MDTSIEYLVHYLEDEFRETDGVRIRVAPRAGKARSPDLEQDYDAESNSLHLVRGVLVQARGRDYLFPAQWVESGEYQLVKALARQIHERLTAPG